MQISKYFASLGIEIEKGSVKKVDKALDHVENRLKKLGKFTSKPIVLDIGNFNVDQKKLNFALGSALDVASTRLTFEISRFNINQSRLNGAMINAMANASAVASRVTNISPGGRATPQGRRAREAAVTGIAAGAARSRGMPSLYGPAIGLALGGYGLSALNKRNQEVVASQLQSSAVIQQQGGSPEQGKESFEWLRRQANDIGFNYLKASPEYNNLLANMTGAGFSVKQGQNVFKSFAELSRTYKLGSVQQQRVFLALSQIAGKGQLQSQELKLQLGQALPGAEGLFATAYQKMVGGKLTGQESIAALLDAMKKGKVSADILNYVSPLVHEKAVKGGLDNAKKASAAEQARYENAVSNLAVVASDAGVEEGFARIFRTLNAGLSESGDLVRVLAEGFNDATKWADDLVLFPQSFIRALEGKDSLVADWLGVDKTQQLQKDWQNIKQIFTDISSIKFDFLPTLEATAKDIARIMNSVAEFQRWKNGNLPTETIQYGDIPRIDPFGMGEYTSPKDLALAVINNTGVNMARARERGRAVYDDPTSLYYHDAAGYDDQQAEMAKAAAADKAMGIVTNNSNQINIEVNVDGSTLAGMDASAQAHAIGEAVANMFVQSFEQVNVQFPVKE